VPITVIKIVLEEFSDQLVVERFKLLQTYGAESILERGADGQERKYIRQTHIYICAVKPKGRGSGWTMILKQTSG
jgi:hypothetical protein